MYFKDIAGQTVVKQQLLDAFKKQRIPHAMLFSGPEGNGKLGLAIAFARYIACKNRTENDACGTCPSCVKFNKLEHPDMHFVFPVVKKKGKQGISDEFVEEWRSYIIGSHYVSINGWMLQIDAENKQPIIYTEESESIVKKANTKSYEGGYKFMIIYYPERMHLSCANKLLKLIEEPPDKTLFILVSENSDQLLTTILSRCQIINIPRIADEELKTALLESEDIEDSGADEVVRLAGGNFVKARELISQSEENRANLEYFIRLMRQAYGRDIVSLKQWTEEMASSGRENQKNFLNFTQRLIRENFILNLRQEDLNYMSAEERNFSVKFSPFVNERNVIKIYEELDLAQRHIEQNVHGKMVFFDLCLKMIMLLKS
ncbi:DNA polymerase III subunit delta' [Saccharicrinis sp. FJH2]|uniref:DNA polymerase III subunit delta' n=1 Tax=Saccharicrinis sp. FJH65 TaxID=3344659 RepID=UPI0035F3AD1A